MVKFENIIFDEEWIYAKAYDYNSKLGRTIKISRKTDEFYSDFEDISRQVNKAALNIKLYVEQGKIKQHSSKAIAWG